ncbi:MAG: alpha/beta hydrolase [Planctomycetota bacterium]
MIKAMLVRFFPQHPADVHHSISEQTARYTFICVIVLMLGFLIPGTRASAERYEVTATRDICYATYGDRSLSLDLFSPNREGPLPTVVLVHGGGWVQGSRDKFEPLARAIAERGYVVANISYRLATEAMFPAAVSDVKAATRWLRAHAKKHRVDPTKVIGIGGSAGGHLIAMAGLTPGKFEGSGGWNDRSSALAGVVVMGSGVDQVARVKESKSGDIPNCITFFGGSYEEVPQMYRDGSPINYVSSNTPPILFLDGSLDRPGQRYVTMRRKLDELSIHHELSVIEGAKHGQWNKVEFRQAYVDEMARFIEYVASR